MIHTQHNKGEAYDLRRSPPPVNYITVERAPTPTTNNTSRGKVYKNERKLTQRKQGEGENQGWGNNKQAETKPRPTYFKSAAKGYSFPFPMLGHYIWQKANEWRAATRQAQKRTRQGRLACDRTKWMNEVGWMNENEWVTHKEKRGKYPSAWQWRKRRAYPMQPSLLDMSLTLSITAPIWMKCCWTPPHNRPWYLCDTLNQTLPLAQSVSADKP